MNTAAFASASLYVGDLAPEINEAQLFEVFKKIGPVASIRVCRDAVTRRSLGYAYVNFHQFGDAERAIDLLNFTDVKGRPCRIMWSQRDPSLRKSGLGNLFIKNLDKSVDNKALYDTFSLFGNILSCKVAQDELGNSKGFGFVHYETGEAAEAAVEKVNGKLIAGKKAFVGFFLPKKERLRDQTPKWTNIYVKNIPKSINTDEQLREEFKKFGKITSCVIMKDENSNSKGFGFINFEVHEEAKAATEEMNGKEIDGFQLFVGRAQKKAERERELKDMFEKLKRERMSKYQGVNLYVKNLEETIDDAKLRQEFSHVGTITSAKVMRDDKGNSKGFGFVCFATPDEATKAVTEMNGKMIASKPIYVALAQRKEQRRAQLEAQHAARANGIRMQQQAQAAGMTGNPLYATGVSGAPVFYAQPVVAGPGNRSNFVYPVAGRYPGAYPQSRSGYQPMSGNHRSQVPSGRGAQQRRGGKNFSRGGNQNSGNYPIKYSPNVRNPQQPSPAAQPDASTSPEERRQMLGETLYPIITNTLKELGKDEELAGKITGMVLELPEQELTSMVESPEIVTKKVNEALEVLSQHKDEDSEKQ